MASAAHPAPGRHDLAHELRVAHADNVQLRRQLRLARQEARDLAAALDEANARVAYLLVQIRAAS